MRRPRARADRRALPRRRRRGTRARPLSLALPAARGALQLRLDRQPGPPEPAAAHARARAARRRAAGDDINPPIRAPRGVERVTRHPFFVGVALLASAHVLLATRLVGAVFFAGLAALAILGAWHQDRTLPARP